jgi:septal ring factor EnvC (AmiA/AmiB activator)
MNRTLKALSGLILGGMLLVGTGCEDKQCQDALAKANTAVEATAKAQKAASSELAMTKAKLAATEAALAASQNELNALKAAAAKPEEPAPAADAKKGKKK